MSDKTIMPVIQRINELVQAHCREHSEVDMPGFVILGADESKELADNMKGQDKMAVTRVVNGVCELKFHGGGSMQMISIGLPSFMALAWSGPITGKTFAAVVKAHKKKRSH